MQAIIEENRERIAELCRAHHVRRMSVFGSAARDDFDPERSDVDLLVEFEAADQVQHYARNFFALQRALRDLLSRDVDLVIAGSLTNRVIARGIEAEKRPLYAA